MTQSEIRDHSDLCPALLRFLQRSGGKASVQQVYAGLRAMYRMPSAWNRSLETSNGEPKWQNKIRWARNYLCDHGLIDRRPHGTWKLTRKGELTAPDACPRPTVSFRTRRGYTKKQLTNAIYQLGRQHPEVLRELCEKYGLDVRRPRGQRGHLSDRRIR